MEAKLARPDASLAAIEDAAALEARYGRLEPEDIIGAALERFGSGLAAVSSFGADSAVLLHMIATVEPSLAVVFLETHKHFGETIEYRDALVADLGLTKLIVIEPDADQIAATDPHGMLHKANPDACCDLRKTQPLARALQPYRAWLTGRKRHQAATRSAIPVFEASGGRVRVNPLAAWGTSELVAYVRHHALRENPLVAYGYYSIGCFPCTQPSTPDDPRAGRWAGTGKTECGIHLSGLDRSLTDSSL